LRGRWSWLGDEDGTHRGHRPPFLAGRYVGPGLLWLGELTRSARNSSQVRRHWTLVCCAFSFCWHAGQAEVAAAGPAPPAATAALPAAGQAAARGARKRRDPDGLDRGGGRGGVVAHGAAAGARLAGPVGVAAALLARMVDGPAAPAVAAGA
jgi:hypothetical protein